MPPGDLGGSRLVGPPPPNFIFNFIRGSGDLRGFGVFPAVFLLFSAGWVFFFFFCAGIPLVAPSGGSWWLHGPFLGGPGRVRPAPAAVGVQPSSP